MSSSPNPGASEASNVFNYLSYRTFLRDQYQEKKKRGLSYRSIARRVGASSGAAVKLVLDGERNLSEETAQRYAEGFDLKLDARAYFLALVRFNQARTKGARSRALRKLRRLRQLEKTSCGGLRLEAMTVTLDEASLLAVQRRIRYFRKQILEIGASHEIPEEAMRVELELAPLAFVHRPPDNSREVGPAGHTAYRNGDEISTQESSEPREVK